MLTFGKTSLYLYNSLLYALHTDYESTVASECEHGSVRLGNATDGKGVREGRVEVCINRAWGTVCNRLFTQVDADIVCNQLPGFSQEGKLKIMNSHIKKIKHSIQDHYDLLMMD